MKISKDQIKPVTLLAGLHLHKPDYNWKQISGELFNFINDISACEFEIITPTDNMMVLLSPETPLWEVKFLKDKLIYTDDGNHEDRFIENTTKILEKWQELNGNAKHLRLAGLMRRFILDIEKPKSNKNSHIVSNYIKAINTDGKKLGSKIHLRLNRSMYTEDYNININLEESTEQDYSFEVHLDVNQNDLDKTKKIDSNKVKKIFRNAQKYYKNDFFKDISIDLV